MKHLVVAVSLDSSLELLESFADVIVLDTSKIPPIARSYETLYIRSHFSKPETLPQVFRNEINIIVNQATQNNQNIRFIDGMNAVDDIVSFEDKWLQYQRFSDFMPITELLSKTENTSLFKRPVYKNRLSSRGTGVTWDSGNIIGSKNDWIIQESLNIVEELRVYVVRGTVCQTGAIRQSMLEGSRTSTIESRKLSKDEIEFAAEVGKHASDLDLLGLDIARTFDGALQLMEANRSPGFAAFADMTGINLAHSLYEN